MITAVSQIQNSKTCYEAVARIHMESINLGFLTSLGEPFLALLYQAIDRDSHSTLIVELQNDRIIGFIAGGTGMKSVIKELLKEWPKVTCALLPSIFKLSVLRKVFDLLWLASHHKPIKDAPPAELLSVAVTSEFRGLGVGMRLYRALENHFRAAGHHAFCVVVGETLDLAHHFYLNVGAEKIGYMFMHKGNRSVVYKQLLNQAKVGGS